MKKFLKIPAYPGLCGVVRNERKFLEINVHFAFCWFVGIGEKFSPERNKPAANSRIVSEQTTQRSFLEQDSTTVPNFANRSFCPMGILLGLPPQARLLRLAPLEKIHPRKELKPMKKYNTPHRHSGACRLEV